MKKVKFPNPDTSAGKILAALLWARSENRKPALIEIFAQDIPFGSIAGFELARVCGDYRARISNQLRANGFKISMMLSVHLNEQGNPRRTGSYRLESPWPLSPTERAAMFPDEYLEPGHMVQFRIPKGIRRVS